VSDVNIYNTISKNFNSFQTQNFFGSRVNCLVLIKLNYCDYELFSVLELQINKEAWLMASETVKILASLRPSGNSLGINFLDKAGLETNFSA